MGVSAALQRLIQKDDRKSWLEHARMIRRLRQWKSDVAAYPVLDRTDGDVTAYVANFLRPQNIAPIVRSLLACPSVGRIIVSNNNPDCRLERWFRPEHERVMVLRHASSQSCSMRHVHLRSYPSPFYLILDDDVFLLPHQLERLIGELKNEPSVPHGLYGQQWNDTCFHGGFERIDGAIDVISRVYAFTDRHLERLFALSAAIGIPEDHPDWGLSRFDDILLSCSGSGVPWIHDTGPLVDCPTQGRKGTATWREEDFHREREEVYRRLCALKPLSV